MSLPYRELRNYSIVQSPTKRLSLQCDCCVELIELDTKFVLPTMGLDMIVRLAVDHMKLCRERVAV